MTLHYLRNPPQFVHHIIERFGRSEIDTYVSTSIITNFLCIDDELRAFQHSYIRKFLNAR